MSKIEFHDAANIFPLDDEHIADLAEDIKKHGQHVPIELYDGKILDGRRRYLACLQAEVEPTFCTVDPPDVVAYVLSLNLHRRHLSESQLAIVAGRAAELYDKYKAEAVKRLSEFGKIGREKQLSGGRENFPYPQNAGRALDKIGEAFGISGKTVSHGKKVLSAGTPKLIEAVEQDKIAVSTAAKVALMPPERQDEYVAAVASKPNPQKAQRKERVWKDDNPKEGERQGVGIIIANQAIDVLKRIPKNDGLRKRGFRLVADWMKSNE